MAWLVPHVLWPTTRDTILGAEIARAWLFSLDLWPTTRDTTLGAEIVRAWRVPHVLWLTTRYNTLGADLAKAWRVPPCPVAHNKGHYSPSGDPMQRVCPVIFSKCDLILSAAS